MSTQILINQADLDFICKKIEMVIKIKSFT